MRAVEGADRRRPRGPGAAQRRGLRHRAGRADGRFRQGDGSRRGRDRRDRAQRFRRTVRSARRAGAAGRSPLRRPQRVAGGKPSHPQQAHRAGDGLAPRAAARAGPGRGSALHQRDDLRQPHAALAPGGAGRRADRRGDGAGLPAAGRARHRAGSGDLPGQGRSRTVGDRGGPAARRGNRHSRGNAGRVGRAHRRRHRDRARRRREDRGVASSGRGRTDSQRRGTRSRQGRHCPRQARHHGRRFAPDLQSQRLGDRRLQRPLRLHPHGRSRGLAVHPRRAVPGAGEAQSWHRALGDLHRPRTGTGRPRRTRGAREARRRHQGPALEILRERPRADRARDRRSREGDHRPSRSRPGRRHRRPAGRRTDPDLVPGHRGPPEDLDPGRVRAALSDARRNRQTGRRAAIIPKRCSGRARAGWSASSPDCRSGKVAR